MPATSATTVIARLIISTVATCRAAVVIAWQIIRTMSTTATVVTWRVVRAVTATPAVVAWLGFTRRGPAECRQPQASANQGSESNHGLSPCHLARRSVVHHTPACLHR